MTVEGKSGPSQAATRGERRSRADAPDYSLDDQVGFLLRQASQRHTTIFGNAMLQGLTPTRFAALARLHEMGPLSQNELGRQTAMDVATIKGVVDRLCDRGLTATRPDPSDGRRHLVDLTDEGRSVVLAAEALALEISSETLAPLKPQEAETLIRLLRKIS